MTAVTLCRTAYHSFSVFMATFNVRLFYNPYLLQTVHFHVVELAKSASNISPDDLSNEGFNTHAQDKLNKTSDPTLLSILPVQ